MPPKKKKAAKAPPALDRGEMQQQGYIRQALQSNVVSLKERVKSLAEDNETLRKTRSRVERDTHEFVAYFQTEMEKKDELIATLKDRVAMLEYELRKQTREITERLESEIRMRGEAALETETKLKRKVAGLEDQLYTLRDFRDNSDRVQAQVAALKAELSRKEGEFEDKMTTMERKFLEDKSRILKSHADQFAETKRRAREEAQKQLDSDTKRVILDNRRMAEELRFQQQETAILQQEKADVENQNKVLARELELYVDKEKEYARQGSRRARENKGLKEQVKSLEGTVGKLARDADRTSTAIVAKTGEEVEDLRLEVHALRQLVKLKNKELRTLKKLAETILSQRTEVETFFLEALDSVKAGIRQQREMSRKTAASVKGTMASGARSLKFPALADSEKRATSSPGETRGERVELKDLSLEDRERVLRLLFAKINSVSSRPKRPGTSGSDPGGMGGHASLLSTGGMGDDVHMGGPFGLTAGIPDIPEDSEF